MEQLKAFLEKAGTDSELSGKLDELGEDINKPETIIAFAAEHGFTITVEEIEDLKSKKEKSELNEEELEAVAGGGWSVNRYCKEWCKNLKSNRIACRHPFLPCDHFNRVWERSEWKGINYYWYSCNKNAFPKFLEKEYQGSDYSGA